MSQVLDSKVVEMKFDNRDFEKNVSTSMSTLEKLQNKLKFGESSRAFDELDSASRRVSFDGLGSAIEKVQVKFSNMQVVFARVLMNMVDDAYNAGKRLIASLSIDQITSGWDKYAEKTTSVQTIMAATREEFAGMDNQMELVSEQIAKLNWFTDETSYNFVDMTSNIGKFTSAGQKLDDSVKAMQGIANVAAISGQNAQAASRAMYNFSQSLGMGYVGLTDWMSIENANMATAEFKQTLIDTAVEMGVIAKESVTIQNFRETLKDKWLDAEVLTEALNKYGKFSVELGEVMTQLWDDGFDLTTSEFVNFVEEFKKNKTIPEEVFKTFGDKAGEVSEIIKHLGDDTYDLGFRSFKAAQEAKTFAEALDSVKDAVSTGWMNTFELIFGNYEQAKELWTELANRLYDVFAASGESRNDILKEWSELPDYMAGSRSELVKTFWELWDIIGEVLGSIREAFEDIFPPITWKNLYDLTLGFKDFVKSIKPTEEVLENIKRTFKGLFAIFDIGKQLISAILSPIGKLLEYLGLVGETVLDTTASWGDWLVGIADFIRENKVFEEAVNRIVDIIVGAYNFISTQIQNIISSPALTGCIDFLVSLFTGAWDILMSFFDSAGNAMTGFFDNAKNATSIGDVFTFMYEAIKSALSGLGPVFDDASNLVSNIVKFIWDKITALIEFLSNINWGAVFAGLIGTGVVGGLVYTLKTILGFFNNIGKAVGGFGEAIGDIGDAIAHRIQYGKSKSNLSILVAFVGIAAALAGIIIGMSAMNIQNAIEYAGALGILLTALAASFFILSKSDGFEEQDLSAMYKTLGVLTLVLAGLGSIIMMISTVDTSNAITGATAIGLLLLALSATLILLDKTNFNGLSEQALISMGIMELLLLGLVGIIALLGVVESSGIGPSMEIVQEISLLILALSGSLILLELAGLAGPAVYSGLAALTILIGELALMVIGLGALQEQFPILKDVVDNGIDLLCKLGEGLGQFFGSIVGGFMDSASAGLVKVGEHLSEFMEAAKPFIDGMDDVDPGLVNSIDTIMNAILKLALSDFLNAITSFITGGQDYSKFGKRLVAFADAYQKFADAMTDVDTIAEEKLTGMTAIVTLYDKMPNFGGLVEMFTGKKDLTKFGVQLLGFAVAYKQFAEVIQDVKPVPENTLNDIIAITDWYDKAPHYGGLVQMFTGEQNLDIFGGQLQRFAQWYKRFADEIQGVKMVPEETLNDMIAITDWYNKAPQFGGLVQMFTGTVELDTFGNQLAAFATGYSIFATIMSDAIILPKTKLDKLSEFLVWANDAAPKEGSIFDIFTGTSSFDTMGTNLKSFGEGYSYFADAVSKAADIKDDQISRLDYVLDTVATSAANLGFRLDNMTSVSGDLSKVGTNLYTFSNTVGSMNYASLNNIVNLLKDMVGIEQTLDNIDAKSSANKLSTMVIGLSSDIASAIENSTMNIAIDFTESLSRSFTSDTVTGTYSILLSTLRSWFTNITDNIIDDISSYDVQFMNSGKNLLFNFTEGLSSNINPYDIRNMINVIKNTIRNYRSEFYDTGRYMMEGFNSGMKSYSNIIANSSRELGRTAANALRDELDIHSPSKVTSKIGRYFSEGFINSIEAYSDVAYYSAERLGSEASRGLASISSDIASYIENDATIRPVISPVLDMDNIDKDLSDLYPRFGETSINMAIGNASSFNNMLDRKVAIESDNHKLAEVLNTLRSDMNRFGDKVSSMKVVMDTGALVGEISSPLDSVFGSKTLHNSRGR